MNLGYVGWVLAWYFVHFLVMYLQCTGPGHHPLLPVSPPPPTTPPSNLDEFSHPNSPVPEGQVTGFGCNVALDSFQIPKRKTSLLHWRMWILFQ